MLRDVTYPTESFRFYTGTPLPDGRECYLFLVLIGFKGRSTLEVFLGLGPDLKKLDVTFNWEDSNDYAAEKQGRLEDDTIYRIGLDQAKRKVRAAVVTLGDTAFIADYLRHFEFELKEDHFGYLASRRILGELPEIDVLGKSQFEKISQLGTTLGRVSPAKFTVSED